MAVGSQIVQNYTIRDVNGALLSLIGKTFEFSIRTDPVQTSITAPLISVNSTSSTASGTITVNTVTSVVTVTVTATAMATITQRQYYYTLWMDPTLADATAVVAGTLFAANVAAP